jgi:hypothetical protein
MLSALRSPLSALRSPLLIAVLLVISSGKFVQAQVTGVYSITPGSTKGNAPGFGNYVQPKGTYVVNPGNVLDVCVEVFKEVNGVYQPLTLSNGTNKVYATLNGGSYTCTTITQLPGQTKYKFVHTVRWLIQTGLDEFEEGSKSAEEIILF